MDRKIKEIIRHELWKGRKLMKKIEIENVEVANLEPVNGGKVTLGDIVSLPCRVPMYVLGANIGGLCLGFYEGFGDVWYTSNPEKRWTENQKD